MTNRISSRTMSPLEVEGWFKVIMPNTGIKHMEKILYIGKTDWHNPLVRSLFNQGCEFEPVNVFTDDELVELMTDAIAGQVLSPEMGSTDERIETLS